MNSPTIAVVIPVYKQPQFLAEAVLSAVQQDLDGTVRVVIVNDGCPYESTHRLGMTLSAAHPGRVHYFRRLNGGLSAARNYGIRLALAMWPECVAVFPLDSDNRLSSHTVRTLWSALAVAGDDVRWAYQDLLIFGAKDSAFLTGGPFSLYRLLHENFSDAGSLIHREVFEAGIWYDEAMRDGYEDWEFFIHAGVAGLRGVHVPETAFLYRDRGHSMVSAAQAKHESIMSHIRGKHASAYSDQALTQREHEEMPRFAVVDCGVDSVAFASDPLAAGELMSREDFVGRLVGWRNQAEPKTVFIPPMTIFLTSTAAGVFSDMRVLPGLLLTLQGLLKDRGGAWLTLAPSSDPHLLSLVDGRGPSADVLVVNSQWLYGLARDRVKLVYGQTSVDQTGGFAGLTLHVGSDLHPMSAGSAPDERVPAVFDEFVQRLDLRLRASHYRQRVARRSAATKAVNANRLASHADFARNEQLGHGPTRFPRLHDGRLQVLFAVPWLTYGGVDKCVAELARGLVRTHPDMDVHLVTTESSDVAASRSGLAGFATVSLLSAASGERLANLSAIVASMDVVINAHSFVTYEALPVLRRASKAVFTSYLHVVDEDDRGMPAGYPVSATQQYEALIDHYAVISSNLRNFCITQGVPSEKITVIPNAPAVRPGTDTEAMALVASKNARRFDAAHPLRILYMGRFDRQKGVDRLAPIATALIDAGVPFELSIVGAAVLNHGGWEMPGVATYSPPTHDADVLARHYREADVFLLPSRWEGVPLAVLEAMSFGALVAATDVGAVREVVEDGVTGVLLSPTEDAEALSAEVANFAQRIVAAPEHYVTMREAAVERALAKSWERSAAALGSVVKSLAGRRA